MCDQKEFLECVCKYICMWMIIFVLASHEQKKGAVFAYLLMYYSYMC
jgi:prolipoprotein diacylglyceryltransferase